MSARELMLPASRAFNSNGLPVAGAVLKLYTTGTNTPQPFYSDSSLTVSLGYSVTANAAGRFDPAYQDAATPFRLRIETSTGTELDDIDPFYFGQSIVTLNSNAVTPQAYGATGDGVTDDYAAFVAAIAALPERGGVLLLPRGYYRLSQKLIITKQMEICGEGWSQNPGTVGAVTYTGAELYTGSVIVCDADVGGIQFVAFTDNASSAPAYEYQSSTGSVLQDIMLYSLGGTGTTAHGVESFIVLTADNVRIEGFPGCGLRIAGDGSGTANQYGNTALTSLKSVSCRYNKLHGKHITGNNSSVIHLLGCDDAANGGVGVLDETPFGNFYAACHCSANNASHGTPPGYSAAQRTKNTTDWAGLSDATAGSFVSTNVQGYSVYSGCYSEFDTGYKAELTTACIVIGGILGTDTPHTASSVPARWNKSNLHGIGKIYSDNTGIVEIAEGVLDLTEDAGGGYNPPPTGGRAQWTAALGLMLGGVGSSYDFGIRNAAGVSVMLVPHNGTSPLFPDYADAITGYKVNGTKVLGVQGAAVADATDAASAITQLNALLARCRAHGLIAT